MGEIHRRRLLKSLHQTEATLSAMRVWDTHVSGMSVLLSRYREFCVLSCSESNQFKVLETEYADYRL